MLADSAGAAQAGLDLGRQHTDRGAAPPRLAQDLRRSLSPAAQARGKLMAPSVTPDEAGTRHGPLSRWRCVYQARDAGLRGLRVVVRPAVPRPVHRPPVSEMGAGRHVPPPRVKQRPPSLSPRTSNSETGTPDTRRGHSDPHNRWASSPDSVPLCSSKPGFKGAKGAIF